MNKNTILHNKLNSTILCRTNMNINLKSKQINMSKNTKNIIQYKRK